MAQSSDEKQAKLLQSRLAKFQLRLTEDDARALVVLLRAQGWKLTARDAESEMLGAVDGVKFAEGTALHSAELVWAKMWEAA